MSRGRYAEEFRNEAVRQVIERGYNDCLFYDIKHYRPIVANKIMDALLHDDRTPEHLRFENGDAQCLNSKSKLVALK